MNYLISRVLAHRPKSYLINFEYGIPHFIVHVNSDQELMKYLLRNCQPHQGARFWKNLVNKNNLLNDFTLAVDRAYQSHPEFIENLPSYPDDDIWNFLAIRKTPIMELVGDFFIEAIDSGKITLKLFPRYVNSMFVREGSDDENPLYFENIADIKVRRI